MTGLTKLLHVVKIIDSWAKENWTAAFKEAKTIFFINFCNLKWQEYLILLNWKKQQKKTKTQ